MKVKSLNRKKHWNLDAMKGRFMAFVGKCSDTGCWLWKGYIGSKGYPQFWIEGRSASLAHRASYILFKSDIKRDKVVDHKCNNRLCVNPEHLQAISHSKNLRLIKRRNGNGDTAKMEI